MSNTQPRRNAERVYTNVPFVGDDYGEAGEEIVVLCCLEGQKIAPIT